MRLLAALFLAAYLLIDSGGALFRAREAMALWAASVAPSLFPFFALLPALTDEDALSIYEKLFGKIMQKLFRISGAAAAPCAVGLIAGSPAGSIAALRAYESGAISRKDARVLAALSTGASPIFIVSSVGAGMLKNVSEGIMLLLCAWTASFAVAFFVSRLHAEREDVFYKGETRAQPPGAIREAVMGVMTVAGYMTVFSVFAGGLPDVVYAFFELSGGCTVASGRHDLILAAAVIGFGGVCLIMQNTANFRKTGVRAREIVLMKICTGAVSAIVYPVISSFGFPDVWLDADAYCLACIAALLMTLLCAFNRLFLRRVRAG
ncbi:MAG: hypothetical protein IIX93_05230 [Clostridia bacterium]|nr:hypothetical protein [Clostridia bacterium]